MSKSKAQVVESSDDTPVVVAEKKSRKPNDWNVYYKTNHQAFKSAEEHKGKSHIEVTKALAASYKAAKSKAAAESASSDEAFAGSVAETKQ